MNVFKIYADQPLCYHFTGKFEAPNANWIHQHSILTDYELIVMTKGTLYISYNKQNYTLSEGEMLLLPPLEEPNNYRNGFRPSECSFYWLHFACHHPVNSLSVVPSSLTNHASSVTSNTVLIPTQMSLPHSEKVIVLMKQLQDAIRLKYTSFSLDYMTTIILLEIYHQFLLTTSHTPQKEDKQKQIFNDIIDYIKQNIHTKLTVTAVAKHFGYNEKYLSHMFSKTSNISLKQFILKNKIDAANFLLTDTNQSIQDIALYLGFTDYHNFMKCYKKNTGLTPSEYRNAFSKRLLYHK
ncbi:MAG: AraC family transcriptional regulator [Cellulosilyticum sp.]|nr:AraC family transcriptional regulator [Cellulosilyticum sp.]